MLDLNYTQSLLNLQEVIVKKVGNVNKCAVEIYPKFLKLL